jgi:hypothetical protein
VTLDTVTALNSLSASDLGKNQRRKKMKCMAIKRSGGKQIYERREKRNTKQEGKNKEGNTEGSCNNYKTKRGEA